MLFTSNAFGAVSLFKTEHGLPDRIEVFGSDGVGPVAALALEEVILHGAGCSGVLVPRRHRLLGIGVLQLDNLLGD